LAAAGRWLFLIAVMLMVTGDGPESTLRVARWPTPAPALSWSWLYLVLLALAFFCLAVSGRLRAWRPPSCRFLAPALALLLGTFLLSAAFSQAHRLSAVAWLLVLAIVLVCWIVAVALEDDTLAAATWPAVAVAVLFLAVRVVLWRRDEGLDVAAFQVLNNAWVGKLQLAWVFNLIAPLLLAKFMGERRWPIAVLYGFTWAAAGIATYLLFSRMGSVVFGVSTLGVWLLNRTYWRRAVVIVLVAAALSAGLLARSGHMTRYVVATILAPDQNPGVGIRLGVWRDSLRLFRAHPVTGTGIGTFDEVVYSLEGNTAEPIFRQKGWHAHNVYLHVLAETGVLGLAAWCWFWYVVIARLVRGWRQADPHARLEVTATLCAVGAFLALSMTEVLIGARVHASLRMNLTIGLVLVLGLRAVSRIGESDREGWIRGGRLH